MAISATEVIASFTTFEEDGTTVKSIDLAGLDAMRKEITDLRKSIVAANKAAEKAVSDAEKDAKIAAGKALYMSLADGATFKVIVGGNEVEATKVMPKKEDPSTARCSYTVDGVEKTANIHFDKVITQ